MTVRRALPLLLPGLVALPAAAQEAPVALDCRLTSICLDTSGCRDWDQALGIRGGPGGWQVTWNDADLPSDYALVSDLPSPAGALAETRLVSLLFANPDTQSVQILTVETAGGHLAVTGHQPQATPRAVTSYGRCEGAR
jgi:hypothetical protein